MPHVVAYLLSLGIFFAIFFSLLGLLYFIFWIWMLVDAITNPALDDIEKLIWVAVIFFLHFVGPIVYFFVAKSKPPAAPPL